MRSPTTKMTTKSVRRRNARNAKRKRRKNTRNTVVAMKTLIKMLTSVVQESTNERADRQNGARAITRTGAATAKKRSTAKNVVSRATVVEVVNTVARNAQGMAVVARELADMVLTHTAPVVKKVRDMEATRTALVVRNAQGMAVVVKGLVDMALTHTALVARNLQDTVGILTPLEVGMVLVKRAQAMEVNKPLVMAATRMDLAVATEVVRSRLATVTVRAVGMEAAAMMTTSMARGSSSMEEVVAMVVAVMRGMATGTEPLLCDPSSALGTLLARH
jgi:hypothetical protein